MVYESRTAGQWRITPESAEISVHFFEEELFKGRLLKPVSIPWNDLNPVFESLVNRHTQKHGFRTYDLIHVSSAIVLKASTFWSYDKKALQLAELEGLGRNPL